MKSKKSSMILSIDLKKFVMDINVEMRAAVRNASADKEPRIVNNLIGTNKRQTRCELIPAHKDSTERTEIGCFTFKIQVPKHLKGLFKFLTVLISFFR